MKKILLVLLISVFAAVFVLPVFAGSDDSLQIQVSTPLVSVSLSEDTVNFGTVALGQEKEASVFPVATNDGAVKIDLDMKGTNATHGTHSWALDDVNNGDDRYMLMISRDSDWVTEVLNLSTGYQDFYNDPPLDVNSGQSFNIKILMPETTSAYGDYTAQITVLATQSL